MATLTIALKNPGGADALPDELKATITTADGTVLDQITHRVLGGAVTLKDNFEWEPPDLTVIATGSSAGAVYRIAASGGGSLKGRQWFWDGHADKFLDQCATSGPETVTGPVIEAYDDTDVRNQVGQKLSKASNLSDLASPSTARTNLGLGSAATHPAADFDAAGAATAAQSAATTAAAADATTKANAERDRALAVEAVKADLVGGKVPTAQIPSISTHETVAVANRAAMLALTSSQVQQGDIAVIGTTGAAADRGLWLLNGTDPSVIGNWVKLDIQTGVTSIQGQTGTIVLAAGDVGALAASARGAASGVAPLDGSSVVPDANLPTRLSQASQDAALGPGGTAGNVGQSAVNTAIANAKGGFGLIDASTGSVFVFAAAHFGIAADGTPYYDTLAATPGEEAALVVDPASPTGLSLVKYGA